MAKHPVLLQPDVLAIIFTLSLPPKGLLISRQWTAPVHVSQVCRLWRHVALSMPSLWTRLHFENYDYSGYFQWPHSTNIWKLWLMRSKPLSVKFTVRCHGGRPSRSINENPYKWDIYPFLQLIAENYERWSSVDVHYPFPEFPYAIFVPTLSSSLKSFLYDQAITILPMLSINVERFNAHLDYEEMSHLRLDPLKPVVIFNPWRYCTPNIIIDPSEQHQAITLPNVKGFRIHSRMYSIRPTLGCYTLPALQSLDIDCVRCPIEVFDNKAWGIPTLLRRSSASLVDLALKRLPISPSELFDALKLSPRLKSLTMRGCGTLDLISFLQYLTANLAGPSDTPCPLLQEINFYEQSLTDDLMAAMVDMIISRWGIAESSGVNLSISLDISSRLGWYNWDDLPYAIAEDERKKEELKRCVSEGLTLTMVC